jgi:putative ABC transport system permease protein
MLEIIRYLLRRKVRTALTVLAVAVGIFAVTTVGGIAEQMETLIGSVEESAESRLSVQPASWDKPLTETQVRQLRRVAGVAGVTIAISDMVEELEENQVTVLINPETFSGTASDIPGLEYEPPVGVDLWAGRVPAPGSRAETVVSWDIAQDHDLQVGDVFTIRERPFRVVGIWGYVAVASLRTAQISYDTADELATPNPFRGVGTVTVIPLAGVDIETLARRIEQEVDGVNVLSPREAMNQARQQVLIFTLIVGASGILSLLIGTFTIVNSMIVSVHERRREIGLKKALGAADTHVLAEIVAEAGFIGGLGGIVGVLAGLAVSVVANRALFDTLGTRLFLITPRLGIGAIVFTVLMGIMAGLYPAWQAARLDPVVTLRGGGAARYAARGLKRLLYLILRNARVILTVTGIAVGIFALVVLGSLAEYLDGLMSDAIQEARSVIAVYPAEEGVPFGRIAVNVVRRIPGVRGVVLIGGGDTIDEEASAMDTQAARFYGIETPFPGDYGMYGASPVEFAAGRDITPGSLDEVVVAADVAVKYNLRVGDTLTIRERDFTVVGICKRVPYDLFSNANGHAYITLDALALVMKQPFYIGSVAALLAPGADPQQVVRAIEAELPGVEALAPEEIVSQISQLFTILVAIMAGLLSIAVFVGSVSVVNTMVIAVNERTREIGLKKAVGAGDTDILAEVLADAGKLGGMGGLLGVLAAAPVVALLNVYARTAGGFTIMQMTPRLIAGAIVFSTLLGMLSGLFPAWRAARLDPVVALRTE